MYTSTWDRLWEMHYDTKDKLMFFIKPNAKKNNGSSNERKGNSSTGGSNFTPPSYTTAQKMGLIIGPLLFILTLLFFQPEGLSNEGQAILASTLWIATWWMTEAIPIPATSLLPLILFPMTGALGVSSTASAYGNGTIFLFLGGFVLALAMERWNLHRRIAVNIILVMGTNTNRIVLGFMVATGFLSMWIS